MDVYAVAGGEGAGKTTTALNLTVALRDAGAYAAVFDADLGGNVASLLDVEFDHTFGDVVDGANVSGAIAEAGLDLADVPESEMAAYRKALAADRTQFRAGEDSTREGLTSDADEPDVDVVPVVAGFGDRAGHTTTDPGALNAALEELEMAYEVLVVDTGNGPATQSPTVDVADGVLAVATPDPGKTDATRQDAEACSRAGTGVMGVVVNRAGETTSITDVTDAVGAKAFGVVPEDARTRGIEPVAFSASWGPAALAYQRLAGKVIDWDGTSGLLGPTPAASGESPAGTDVATDGDGEGGDDGDDDSGGFLSGLFG